MYMCIFLPQIAKKCEKLKTLLISRYFAMAVACTVVTYILISTPAINRINGFSMIF